MPAPFSSNLPMHPAISSLPSWRRPRCRLLCATLSALFILFMKVASASQSHDHVVGGSIWSIPVCNDFYTAWSGNRSFFVGDDLVFRFETGMSNVVQVSRREFESCSAENAFRSFEIGPATVSLAEQGMHYFICSYGNYCPLGQKVSVQVQRH